MLLLWFRQFLTSTNSRIPQIASFGLDEDRSRLYFDLVLSSLSEAARRALGINQGNVQGRAALIVRQLTLRFGPLADDVSSRIASASIEDLDAMGERLLTAKTLREALNASGRG